MSRAKTGKNPSHARPANRTRAWDGRTIEPNGPAPRNGRGDPSAPPALARACRDAHGSALYLCDGRGQVLWRNGLAASRDPLPCERPPDPAIDETDPEAVLLKAWGASPRKVTVFLATRQGDKMLAAVAGPGISPRTAEHHLASLYRRTGVHSRAELEAKIRAGLHNVGQHPPDRTR